MLNDSIIDQLEAQWRADASLRRPPPQWANAGVLAGRSPYDIVTAAHRGDDPAGTEAALSVLVRRAPSDRLATLTVAHVLLPGVKALLGRLRLPGSADEAAATAIAALWDLVVRYPFERREGSVAGNLSADLLKRLLVERDGAVRQTVGTGVKRRPLSVTANISLDSLALEEDHAAEGQREAACRWYQPVAAGDSARLRQLHTDPGARSRSAGIELLELLVDAVSGGGLPLELATLIAQTRICGTPADTLAGNSGLKAQSVRRNRQRAERQLAAAFAA